EFSAPAAETCSKPYQVAFFDQSSGAKSWLWNFGDGDTSSQANPVHQYATPGNYTVTLTIDGICGGNDTETKTNLVRVSPAPPNPTVIDDKVNCRDQATLIASGPGVISWFDVNGNFLQTGDTLITPPLSQNTDFLARTDILPLSQKGGAPNNQISTDGGIFASPQRFLEFDVLKPSTLRSVLVYANTAGPRTIEHRDPTGQVLSSVTVNVPTGASRVTLDFPLQPGQNQQLALNSTNGLFRNRTGASYPYNIGGMLTITNSTATSAPLDFYYFFYDWEVQGEGCRSDRATAIAEVVAPDAPEVGDTALCEVGAVNLTAKSTGQVNWYDTNGALLQTGNSFTTPSLTTTALYVVETEIQIAPQNLGPATPATVGTGGYHNSGFDAHLLFEVFVPVTLRSVLVDAGDARSRDIILYDENGATLQTITRTVPSGQSRVQLDLQLQPGRYRLGGINTNLYRNDAGANFPYDIAGVVTITGSAAGPDFYYYFYDWEVQEASCFSDTSLVTVRIQDPANFLADFNSGRTNGSTFQFNDLTPGATTWQWNFGDGSGSSQQNPQYTYATPGTYTVTLTVSDGVCTKTVIKTIDAWATSIADELGLTSLQLYPNPGKGTFFLELEQTTPAPIKVSIFDPVGREVQQAAWNETTYLRESISLKNAANGTYL
ncbi:MAG: PKD domain-containing protein, partial [Bacteroidota bacterium]